MASTVLELDADALWRALEQINPVDVLSDELVSRVADRPDQNPDRCGKFIAGPVMKDGAGVELALLEDRYTGDRCLLPADFLRASRVAALSALAARRMVVPTVVTATVLGTSPEAQLHLAVVARHVPDVDHIAVCPGPDGPPMIEPRVRDQVDLAGIGLSIVDEMADAVLGANLVIVTDPGPWSLTAGLLPKGAVVVNATGRDLPEDLVNEMDQIYVDDADGLDQHRHRYFVRAHLTGGIDGAAGTRPAGARRRPDIAASLGSVLAGEHSGRTSLDDTLLVELLTIETLDTALACALQRCARKLGFGVRRPE